MADSGALYDPELAVPTVSGKYPMDSTPGTVRCPIYKDVQAAAVVASCTAARTSSVCGIYIASVCTCMYSLVG